MELARNDTITREMVLTRPPRWGAEWRLKWKSPSKSFLTTTAEGHSPLCSSCSPRCKSQNSIYKLISKEPIRKQSWNLHDEECDARGSTTGARQQSVNHEKDSSPLVQKLGPAFRVLRCTCDSAVGSFIGSLTQLTLPNWAELYLWDVVTSIFLVIGIVVL